MELGEYITLYRKECGMTLDELAAKSGVPKGTINKIIAGTTKSPTLENVRSIANALGKTLNDFDDPPTVTKKPLSELSEEAIQVARDYSDLDQPGRSVVKVVIVEEGKRVKAEQAAKLAASRPKIITLPKIKRRQNDFTEVPVFEEPSAAGLGNPVDEPPSHIEQYPTEYVPSKTDFGVIISGDSMEPRIPNGCVVFVQATPVLDNKEIGIFVLDGKSYCKQLSIEEETQAVKLHSLNPKYDDIEIQPLAELRTLGRVLGGYNPNTKAMIWQ